MCIHPYSFSLQVLLVCQVLQEGERALERKVELVSGGMMRVKLNPWHSRLLLLLLLMILVYASLVVCAHHPFDSNQYNRGGDDDPNHPFLQGFFSPSCPLSFCTSIFQITYFLLPFSWIQLSKEQCGQHIEWLHFLSNGCFIFDPPKLQRCVFVHQKERIHRWYQNPKESRSSSSSSSSSSGSWFYKSPFELLENPDRIQIWYQNQNGSRSSPGSLFYKGPFELLQSQNQQS